MNTRIRLSRRVWWPVIGLSIGLMLTVVLGGIQSERNSVNAQQSFDALTAGVTSQILQRMQIYEYGLRGARGAILAAGESGIKRATFRSYSESRDVSREFPGARGIGFIRRIPVNEEASFLADARNDGKPDFAIHGFGPNRGERFVIQYIEPVENNKAAVGLDIASESSRKLAATVAMQTGMATITAPITLVQATGAKQRSFLVLLPVYRTGARLDTSEQREDACIGWTYTPLVTDDVLGTVLPRNEHFAISLADITTNAGGDTFYRSKNPQANDTPIKSRRTGILFGRQWQFDFEATPAFIAQLNQPSPRTVAGYGVMASVLFAIVLAYLEDIVRRKRNAALERERFAAVIENTSDAIVGESVDGAIILWNNAATRLFGYTREDAIGRNFNALLVPPGLQYEETKLMEDVVKGIGPKPIDTLRCHRDGFDIEVTMSASLIREIDGSISGVAKSMRDNRERKIAENQLREFNARLEQEVASRTDELNAARNTLQTVFDAIPSMIGYWDANLNNVFANRAYSTWFGVEPAQIHGRHISELLGEELFARNKPFMDAALRGEAKTFERSIPKPDGSGIRHSLAQYLPDSSDGKVGGFYVIVHDVTDITESRLALAREQERLRNILLGTNAGTWEWNVATGAVVLDERWAEILGYRLEELQPTTIQTRIDLAHPDDIAPSREKLLKHFSGEHPFYDFECRLRHKRGHWVWVLDRGRVSERDASGRVLRMHGTLLDLTSIKDAQQRVADSEAFLDRVGVIAGVGGWRYDASTGRLELAKHTRRIADLDDDVEPKLADLLEMFAPESRESIASSFRDAVGQGLAIDIEAPFRTARHREIWVRVMGEPIPDASQHGPDASLVGAFQDITARHAIEQALRRHNATQRAILDNLPGGLSVFDSALNLVAYNAEFCRLLGLEELFVQGVPTFEDIIRFNAGRGEYGEGDIEKMVSEIVERARHPVPHLFERVRPDGTPIEIRGAPLPDGGFVTTYTDMTERTRIETKLRDALQRAEQASKAKSEFVANMSHEIRTPLNAVLGMTHLLSNTRLVPEQKNYLDMIRVSGQSLLRILNDILDFSKIEAGKLGISPVPFSINDLMRTLGTIMSVSACKKNLELVIDIDPDVPGWLSGDALRLEQVLVNLVGNAIKFTETGEVALFVTRFEEGELQYLRFSVRDTGIGMTESQQRLLFAPFTQADSSTTRRFGGTGLGLAISKRLVELMGGSIEVQSSPGHGSEFSFTFPLRPAASCDNMTREIGELENRRVLVVDDNATSRNCISRIMRAWHWDIDAVTSCSEALEHIKAQCSIRKFDVVLVDWEMLEMDGGTILGGIRAMTSEQSMPVIVMANAHGIERVRELNNVLPADGYVTKPVTASGLFDTLHEILVGRQMPPRGDASTQALPISSQVQGHILLVEDNEFNRIVAKGILEQAGATVEMVDDGQKAVDLLRTDSDRFQLVLMDVQMPVMDGFTATRVIRTELGLTLPILAMTAGVLESEREQCVACGMNDFIPKPVVVDQMLETIRLHLPLLSASMPIVRQMEDVSQPEDGSFDVGQLLVLCGGDAEHERTLFNLIRNVVVNSTDQIASARAAIDEGNLEKAARLFHAMRGAIGSLGATRFAAATVEIEKALQERNVDAIPFLQETVERELGTTVSAANVWLASQTASGQQDGNAALEVGMEELNRLKRLLAEQDMAACDVFMNLRPALERMLPASALHAVQRAIERLDFNAAAASIDEIDILPDVR